MRAVFSIVCLGAIALLISGCPDSPEGAANVKLAEGGGIVKYNGAPLAGANVTFIPDNGPIATGTTDLGGKFKLSTGAMPGVTIGKCKVTVTAYEGGAKPATSENVTIPSSNSSVNVEEMKKKMNLGAKMRGAAADTTAGPKSIIPESYGKPATTTITQTVESDASKNQFTIELKD
jgi:hypothetical protein